MTVDAFVDIKCFGWLSDEYPLKYELRYRLDNGQDWIVPGQSNIFNRQQFKIGPKADGYKLDVRVKIINGVGQYTFEPVLIAVSFVGLKMILYMSVVL